MIETMEQVNDDVEPVRRLSVLLQLVTSGLFGWSAAAPLQQPTATRAPAYAKLRPEIIVHREIRGKKKTANKFHKVNRSTQG